MGNLSVMTGLTVKLDFKLDSEARLKEVAALSTFRSPSPSRLRSVERFQRRGPNFDGVDSCRQENDGEEEPRKND
jgi:hypothetical protein